MEKHTSDSERQFLLDADEITVPLDALAIVRMAHVFVRNAEDRIVYWSAGARDLYGYTKAEALGRLSHQLLRTIFPQPIEEIRAEFQKAGSWHGNLIHIGKAGELRMVASQWMRYACGDEEMVAEINNPYEPRDLDPELRRMLQESEVASRAKDQFLAVLSHELRGPLNSISIWTDALLTALERQQIDQRTLSEGLLAIHRGVHAQAALISDLLDISRIVAGKFQINVEAVELGQAIAGCAQTFAEQARRKDIDFRLKPAAAELWVKGDRVRLEQVLTNLLNNALRYTDKGGVIELETRRVGHRAEIVVHDSGRGFTVAEHQRLFQAFSQLDPDSLKGQAGLGLGLVISKHVVESHAGTISAQSAGLGKGADFVVNLPLIRRPAPKLAEQVAESHKRPIADRLQGKKLLVLDDDEETRKALEHVLTLAGADLRLSSHVSEGWRALGDWHPDCILCNIGLAGLNGYEFAAWSKAIPELRPVPMIAVTAYTSDQDIQRAFKAGFAAHVSKPLEPAALLDAIEQVLAGTPDVESRK